MGLYFQSVFMYAFSGLVKTSMRPKNLISFTLKSFNILKIFPKTSLSFISMSYPLYIPVFKKSLLHMMSTDSVINYIG